MSFTIKIIAVLGFAGAFFLPDGAHAKATAPQTVAVFQDHNGTPCRIREQGTELSVDCYSRGTWQIRPARTSSKKQIAPRIRSNVSTQSSTRFAAADAAGVVRAARSAAFDFEFAGM